MKSGKLGYTNREPRNLKCELDSAKLAATDSKNEEKGFPQLELNIMNTGLFQG